MNIDESGAFEDTTRVAPLLGKVIVDLPFFFESLELAARTGPRTPEVLRNVQQGGVAPRIEEPEALLSARVDAEGRIVESSSEQLPVGAHVKGATLAEALAREWPVLRSDTRTYRVVALESAGSGTTLLAGFVVPSAANHLLRWSTLLSLYMSYALALLIALMALGAVPRLKHVLPTLTPGRRVGFQQKLLASFLVVALVPALLLGAFSVDFIKQRFVQENRDEASYKAQSARKAFINLLHGELQFFLARADLPSFLTGGAGARELGGGRAAMLFASEAADSAEATRVAGSTDGASTEDLVVTTINGVTHLGCVQRARQRHHARGHRQLSRLLRARHRFRPARGDRRAGGRGRERVRRRRPRRVEPRRAAGGRLHQLGDERERIRGSISAWK